MRDFTKIQLAFPGVPKCPDPWAWEPLRLCPCGHNRNSSVEQTLLWGRREVLGSLETSLIWTLKSREFGTSSWKASDASIFTLNACSDALVHSGLIQGLHPLLWALSDMCYSETTYMTGVNEC